MTQAVCIYNPTSDRGRAQAAVRELQVAATQRLAGHDVAWMSTSKPGHAEELAETAVRTGVDRVIAVGGDGTAHEVINGVMRCTTSPGDARPIVGVVPTGSGNDLAFACGLPGNAIDALAIAVNEPAKAIDVARISSDDGRSRWFVNSAGMLLDGAVNHESHRIRRIYGFAMYLTAVMRTLVKHYGAFDVTLSIDGRMNGDDCDEVRDNLVLLAIANGPREGGGFMVAPDASNQDGLLDVLTVQAMPRLFALGLLGKVMSGRHIGHRKVAIHRTRSVTINVDRPTAVHLDGEQWLAMDHDVRSFEVTIAPAALQIAGR